MEREHPLTPRQPKVRRGHLIGFWATEALYRQVVADADRAGLTVSDYLRQLSAGAPVPRKYRAPKAARVELGKFLGHLGKVGSNLNQIARQANRADLAGNANLRPETQEVLAACATVDQLLQEIRAELKASLGQS